MLGRLLYFNFRTLYRLSSWFRRRFTPTGLAFAGVVVAAGIFGVNTRQTLAYQLFALTATAICAGLLFSVRFRPPIRVERRLPRHATAGLPVSFPVEITNTGARVQQDLCLLDELEADMPTLAEFRHGRDPEDAKRNWFDRRVGYPRLMGQIQRRRGGSLAPAMIPPIPPGEAVRVEMQFIPLRRGYLRFGPVRILRPDPLGLVNALHRCGEPETLLVLPKVYRAPEIRLPGQRRFQPGGMTLASVVGDSQEFLALRDYKPGDPLRAIHWRSFARQGRPIVKEFQDEFFVRQGLVLDTYPAPGAEQLFEEAVSVAASFALRAPGRDALLDLMFVGRRAYRFTTGRGLAHADNMLEVLACVEPHRGGDFTELHQLVQRHHAETSALICVLLAWDDTRRHLVATAVRSGIPVLALVVGADPGQLAANPGPLAGQPGCLVAVPEDDVQGALDRAGDPERSVAA